MEAESGPKRVFELLEKGKEKRKWFYFKAIPWSEGTDRFSSCPSFPLLPPPPFTFLYNLIWRVKLYGAYSSTGNSLPGWIAKSLYIVEAEDLKFLRLTLRPVRALVWCS